MERRLGITATHSLLSTFLLVASCHAQDGAGASQKGTATDTLPRSAGAQLDEYVVGIFEDSKGNLWFGTINSGVARWNGEDLVYFTEKDGLCGTTVVGIAEDKEGNLWFGTHTGACKYDGTSFTRLADVESRVFADRKGEIWISRNTGVLRPENGELIPFDLPIDRSAITSYSITPGRHWLALEDSKGNLWFSTDGAGAFMYDGDSFTQFTKEDGLCSNTVWSILEDAQGHIWFTCIQAGQPVETRDGGVCRYDGKSFTKFPEVEGLSGNDIYTIYEERSGKIWIGASHLGAYRYDPSAELRAGGKTFTLFDQTDRPDLTRYFGLQALLEDRNGTLWCGFSGGLFRFNGSSFVNVTQGGPWNGP